MSNNFYPFNNRRYFQKLGYSFDKNLTNNISKNRIESAKTNFTTSNFFNLNRKDNNNPLFNDKPINNSKSLSIKTNKRPIWKYSYYIDKNDILSINNDPEIKNLLNEYKDIDKRPQKIEYSWSKPRMIKIIENNKMIEEDFEKNESKKKSNNNAESQQNLINDNNNNINLNDKNKIEKKENNII